MSQPENTPKFPGLHARIATAAGQEIDLLCPAPESIDIYSVAWSLSQLNRFTGHALRPYSVAEHSLLVSHIAETQLGLDVNGQLAALLHDAHEAFCGDLHTPGKQIVGEAWQRFERHLEAHTHRAFAISTASRIHGAAIKLADLMALATERRDLLAPHLPAWPVLRDIQPVDTDLRATERRETGWEGWRDRFLDRFHHLESARNHALFAQKITTGASA
ncbi:MAG: hypothetical protein RJA98_3825 [Pseudomonadota bacterium]|jgi:5'-deoxynucleotidase YfbR-like HD superfamily hydrolase